VGQGTREGIYHLLNLGRGQGLYETNVKSNKKKTTPGAESNQPQRNPPKERRPTTQGQGGLPKKKNRKARRARGSGSRGGLHLG